MAFTGQIMRFDQDAYWGLGIGASIMGRAPFIGCQLVHLLLGGPIIAGETLSRFFALHVFVIPGLLIAFVGLHLLLVLRLGINEWPMPGRVVTPRDLPRGVRGAGDARRRAVLSRRRAEGPGLRRADHPALVACAAVFGPIGPNGQPDPTIIDTVPPPDFFFLWLFSVFALLPPWTSRPPPPDRAGASASCSCSRCRSLAGTGEKSWRRRPVAVLS